MIFIKNNCIFILCEINLQNIDGIIYQNNNIDIFYIYVENHLFYYRVHI